MNSSHLYTSQEDLFDRATTEAIKRRVGSCEDIYHKAPFFPDITPSESGVSFGESEEGFGFDGEDDNISQQSFESSSAFNEVTVDSEFDRCDSDNFSGTDYTGDKALAVHYEGNADDNGGKRKRGAPRSNYEHEEQESACTSPLTCGESRKREVISNSSWEFDKLQSRTQALRVLIPGSETSAKSVRESNRLDERRMSSTPLAQSTPHVSPGGTDEARLYITPSWSADGISEADSGYAEARKLKSARALFNVEGESKHSSRIEDSSCNSSCSEDNFSDVSNTTISSPVPRKTKLVKKHSDKHLSVKTNTVQNLPGSQTSGVVQRASCQHLKSTSRAVDSKGYDSIVSAEVGGGGYAGQRRQLPLSSFSVTSGEHVSGGKPGDELWTVYSSKKITEHEANAEAGKFGKGDEAFGDEQDKRRPKPLSVNIPLISAGKRGQEKLRQLSQTSPPLSRSSDVSPAVSPRQASGKTEGQPVDQQSRANSEEHSFRPLDGLQRSDRSERYENCESEEEQHRKSESLHTARSLSAVSDITNENDMYSLNKGEVPHVSHKHFQWKSQTREDEENVQKFNLGETELTLAETQIEGAQSNSFEEIASGKYKPDSFPCPEMANVSETRSDVVNCTSVNSRQEVNVLHDNRPIGPKHRAEIDDELGSPEGILSESLRTLDTVSISAGLPGSWIQVSPPASVGDTAAHGASRGNYLDTEISGNTEEVFSEREVAVNASDESTDLQNYREQDEEHLLQKPDKANKECLVHPGESDVRLSLKSALSSHHSAGSLFTETSPVISGVCCDFTENKDGDTLFVEHTLSEGSTGPLTGNLAYGEDEQQKKHGPHLCSRNASTTDACHVQEGMGLSEGIDSHIEVTSSIQSLIRPEITVDLIATGGRIESMRNSSQGLDYVPSLHGQVEVTEDLTSSLLVSSELIKTVESEQVDVSTAVRANSGGKNIQGDLSKGADNINADYLAASGSDKVSDIFNSDIGMPFTVESIQTSSHIAERGGPGMHKQEYFRTERGRGFVERSEEFMFCPSLQDSAVMVVRQIASKCAEHSRRATEEVAASDLIAGHTALGLSCDASSVKSVTEKYTTGAFNAKKDDSYLIITAKNSCVSDESAVSSDGGSLEVSSYSRCSPCSSTSADVACVIVQGNDVPQSGAPAHISPSSQLVTATRLAGHARAEAESCTMKDKSGISDPNIAVDLACSSFRDGCDVSRHCELMASNTRTFTTVTQGANTLDNLQTQLSLISGDPACSRWNASGEVDLYRDHAEATSMLKEIVRGDSSDFVHSSDTSSEHSHMLSEYSVSDVNSNLQAAPREHYDNDYDYVTTSFPKGVKFSPRPHHHHHLQLLKHGHLKVSSLWTLQEETEGVTDSVSPKASPKRSHLSSAWEERTTDNLLPSQQASPTVGKHSSVTKKEDSDQFLNSAREQITPESESSGCDDSDGNYSSVSTSESTSCRSSSLEREQTLLSETDSLAVHLDKSDSLNTEDPSGSEYTNHIITFRELISSPHLDSTSYHNDCSFDSNDLSHTKTFESSQAFCVANPEGTEALGGISALDQLFASLEQFNDTPDYGNVDWKPSQATEELPESYSRDQDFRCTPTHQSPREDKTYDGSYAFQTDAFDQSSIKTCSSPTPSDLSENSVYTCTGSAEIKKISSFHFDVPVPEINLRPATEKVVLGRIHSGVCHSQKIEQFEKLLNELNKGTSETVADFIFLEEKRTGSTLDCEELYKSFTNDDSEKKQNHVCLVLEDESMSAFRFKRFLKKSHTKRKKGRKVLKFLSRLGCVTEAVFSPNSSPYRQAKLAHKNAWSFSSSSVLSPKHRISNPVLISSTSFHHRGLGLSSPFRSTDDVITPSSDIHSMDSLPWRADSAYSSISESAAGNLVSPSFHNGLGGSLLGAPVSSGSVSSVFDSSSSSGCFSSASFATRPTQSSFSEFDFPHSVSDISGIPGTDVMSALTDVFDQLDVCGDEIDTVLLNRLRHGHIQANISKK